MNKVTFTEAATAASVHFNTLRNWRKANKLMTAEKVFENGVEIWVVDLAEVETLARQSRHKRADNNKSVVDGPKDDLPAVDLPGAANNSMTTFQPDIGSLADLYDRAQGPLLEIINERDNTIRELDAELATVKERLRALEAAEAARVAPPAPEPPALVTINPVPEKAPDPVKRGFWQRLFGG